MCRTTHPTRGREERVMDMVCCAQHVHRFTIALPRRQNTSNTSHTNTNVLLAERTSTTAWIDGGNVVQRKRERDRENETEWDIAISQFNGSLIVSKQWKNALERICPLSCYVRTTMADPDVWINGCELWIPISNIFLFFPHQFFVLSIGRFNSIQSIIATSICHELRELLSASKL